MKNKPRIGNSTRSIMFLVLLSMMLSGCSAKLSEHIRKHTYPPNFSYITSKQLHSTMSRLAQQVSTLDRLVGQVGKPGEIQRQEAIQILSKMEAETLSLGKEGWPTNHQEVSGHISQFRREVVAARRALEAQPPGFYLVRTISEACAHCHLTR